MVRERNSSLGTGGLCFGDVVFAARRGRLAGAALLGEVRVAGHAEDNAEQIFCGSGEDEELFTNGGSASAHVGANSARRCGPAVVWLPKSKVNLANTARSSMLYCFVSAAFNLQGLYVLQRRDLFFMVYGLPLGYQMWIANAATRSSYTHLRFQEFSLQLPMALVDKFRPKPYPESGRDALCFESIP